MNASYKTAIKYKDLYIPVKMLKSATIVALNSINPVKTLKSEYVTENIVLHVIRKSQMMIL